MTMKTNSLKKAPAAKRNPAKPAAVRFGRPPKELAGEVDTRILDAARKVFLERGFEGASIDEIAEVARSGKPTIYARFRDKRALFTGVVTRDMLSRITEFKVNVPAGGTIEDVDFLRGMYAAGAKGSMDAMAIHNYGGNNEPERDPGDCGICFRRAEIYRQIMVEAGDSATPVWATEFGWLMDPGKNMGQYDWMRVSADKQADYVVRSFKYARANWPWMTATTVGTACRPIAWANCGAVSTFNRATANLPPNSVASSASAVDSWSAPWARGE